MRNISDFFKNELCDFSCYSTIRMISSSIDGLKNSQRKLIYTAIDKLKSETKVSQFSGIAAIYSEYLHGNLDGVIQNLTADYCGANNIPLFKGEGNFGSRFVNAPSAARYIFIDRPKYFDNIFDIKDVLINQYFEGEKIEPLFYVPSIPILVANGSPGAIATGFKQHILPRNIKDIIKYLKGEKIKLIPYFNNFKGKIYQGENDSQWIIEGTFIRQNKKIIIQEIPIWTEYKKYLEILDKLEEDKKIKGYNDLSNTKTDEYRFEILGIEKLSDDDIIELLKLRRKETEIYNAINRENKVQTFNNIYEILDYYKEIRKEFMELQRKFDLSKLNENLEISKNKYIFVLLIIQDKLKVFKRNKVDIKNDLKSLGLSPFDDFEYLLKMPIHSFTNETLKDLDSKVKDLESEISKLQNLNLEKDWLNKLSLNF